MPVTPLLITGLVAVCVALSSLFIANLLFFAMIGEINGQAKQDDRISYLGYSMPKVVRVFRAYKRLFPSGRLHRYSLVAMILQWISTLVVIGCLFAI